MRATAFPTITKARVIERWSVRFRFASRPTTNGEYIEFIEAGGYARAEFWLSLGWMAVNEQHWQAPLYWEKRDGAWWQFTLSGFRPVDESEPVTHVSYFEADAFANWSGVRLPTEFEWNVSRLIVRSKVISSRTRSFIHDHRQDRIEQLQQMFGDVGNGRGARTPLTLVTTPRLARSGSYNGKFMCNQYVLRGGSCATSRTHIRKTYRNFFSARKTLAIHRDSARTRLKMNHEPHRLAVVDLEPAKSDFSFGGDRRPLGSTSNLAVQIFLR